MSNLTKADVRMCEEKEKRKPMTKIILYCKARPLLSDPDSYQLPEDSRSAACVPHRAIHHGASW